MGKNSNSKEYNSDIIRARCLYVRVHMMKATPETAAIAMKYRNTSMISKMERMSSKTAINVNYLIRLSRWASVSLDYLFGISDYPERDPQTVEQMAIYRHCESFAKSCFEELSRKIISGAESGTLDFTLHNLCCGFDELEVAINRVVELNPEFDDLRAGSKLLSSKEAMRKIVNDARKRSDLIKNSKKRLKQFETALDDAKIQMDLVGV